MKSARRFGDGMLAALGEDYARARSRGRLAGLVFLATTMLQAAAAIFPKSVDAAVYYCR
jgi:hypothetical protein